MLALTAIQGPDQGRKFLLPPGQPQLIGRSSEALPISDTSVSRRHAELTPDGHVWYIRDLKSQNGTYVNGVAIRERIRLQVGDQVRVGSTVLVFGHADAADPAAIRVVGADEMDTEVEHRLLSNEDSVILAVPEPRAAAMDHLRVIYELTTLTTRIRERTDLLREVLALVMAQLGPERGVILTTAPQPGNEMVPVAIRYRDPPVNAEQSTIVVSRTILRAALESQEGVLASNAMTDPRFKGHDSIQRYQIRSAVCSPIAFQDQVFGAILIDSSIANYTFTKDQLALLNAIGRHTGLALATYEQTARRVHAERLAAVGETVASLSHSIKNILQGLRGGADVVEIGLKKGDLALSRNGWDILRRNLDRIVGLTMNMLAFSRQKTLDLEFIKLGSLVDEAATLLAGRCAEKGVALIVDADPEMPPIAVDPSLIHQAVMNLMGNAVEAVDQATGAVTVRVIFHEPASIAVPKAIHAGPAPADPAFVEIRVMDNGPGIPNERLQWIFEPFNSTKGIRGTGLGLAVTRQIVQAHKGRIRVETAPGKGATFRVFIPADLDAKADASATA